MHTAEAFDLNASKNPALNLVILAIVVSECESNPSLILPLEKAYI
jgi:hypothetical protein